MAPEMPKTKPSTIVIALLFGVLLLAVITFYPYLQVYLPFGGRNLDGANIATPYTENELIDKAHYVLIGTVSKKQENIQDFGAQFNDGLSFIIYAEVTLSHKETLLGSPALQDNTFTTYELGGSYVNEENGKPVKVNVTYPNAANLEQGTTYLLFLDDQYNLLGEKYGLYRRINDDVYENHAGTLVKLETIRSELASRRGE